MTRDTSGKDPLWNRLFTRAVFHAKSARIIAIVARLWAISACASPLVAQDFIFDRAFDDPTPTRDDRFGSSVALDGGRALIGAREDDSRGPNVGQANLFDLATGALLQTFDDPSVTTEDHFGVSVALNGNRALVGAWHDDSHGENVGQAYLFSVTTGELLQTFDDPTATDSDLFGWSVAVDGNNVLISAHGDDTQGIRWAKPISSMRRPAFFCRLLTTPP